MGKDKQLLFSISAKDFRVDTFRCSGNGGQNVNKTSSGVRITHLESKAVGESTTYRSQHQNKAEALKRLVASDVFKKWHKLKTSKMMLELQGLPSLEQQVDRAMHQTNIKVEVFEKEGQKWIEEKSS
ncbi:peptide chain release factor-like protein [Paenibacillus sp. FSL R7-0302]|uniref:peptide chain release factor family protein n=1 Tax=Paenibacillus sp. FSL R7-0302 TaxID=2921681 RepID=UPI0030FAAA2E